MAGINEDICDRGNLVQADKTISVYKPDVVEVRALLSGSIESIGYMVGSGDISPKNRRIIFEMLSSLATAAQYVEKWHG